MSKNLKGSREWSSECGVRQNVARQRATFSRVNNSHKIEPYLRSPLKLEFLLHSM